jgi:hypothetical protein
MASRLFLKASFGVYRILVRNVMLRFIFVVLFKIRNPARILLRNIVAALDENIITDGSKFVLTFDPGLTIDRHY